MTRQHGSTARARRRFLFEPLEDRRVMAVTFIDPNPAANNQFGHSIVALSTGNVVVTSPFDDAGGLDAGAVYLFNGTTGALISTLRGSTDFDLVGREGVVALASGNFVVSSTSFHNGFDAVGAVTFGNGHTGVSGVVTPSNSLIGTTASDGVGSTGKVVALPSGNYVVLTPSWDRIVVTANPNPPFELITTIYPDAGAITWGNGTTGTVGSISSANSLTGTNNNDFVGSSGIKVLSNGNYVVTSSTWTTNTGAVTWASGTTATTGLVSAANSLVGSAANSEVGSGGILQLTNGNYVVMSPNWDNGGILNVGAATWVNGTTGLGGTVGVANSLVGTSADDAVGGNSGTALTNGNYVVIVPSFDGGLFDSGAAVWGSGTLGVKGTISSANALIGARSNDKVSLSGVTALTNGNYVVNSPTVDTAVNSEVGAVTWGNGSTGTTGIVGSANSLLGTVTNDYVGYHGVAALSNGHYVVASGFWDNGLSSDVGAVTWGNGTTGTSGAVSAANSMIGGRNGDVVGYAGIVPLAGNGNYIFGSSGWSNGTFVVGAVTWRNGSAASSGVVNATNSLVGSTSGDYVGDIGSMKALSNGNYVVVTSDWDNAGVANTGAVTWGNGTTGISGTINATNSLVGTTAEDKVGNNSIVQLTNGNFVVLSTAWDNGAVNSAGAVTWVNGATGRTGALSTSNSLVGSSASDQVGLNGITPLSNGNYLVHSALYDSGVLNNAGAVTWASGTTGIVGPISAPSVNHAKGGSASSLLRLSVLDAVNGNFYARFLSEGSGTIRVGSQSSGFDVPTVGTLTAAFSGPNLTITDADGIGKDNSITVSRVNLSGTDYYEFTDAVEAFTTAPISSPASTLTNGNRTLRVPASVIGGSLTFTLLGGNDTLFLDLNSGDVVPGSGVFFNGGNPTSGTADKLTISGGVQGNVTYNPISPSEGNIALANFGTIHYTGIEQPTINTGTMTDVVVNLPTTGTNSISFTDDVASGNDRTRMSGSTILTADFANPLGGLTLNYGTPADTVTFNSMPDFTAGLILGTSVFPFSAVTFAAPLNLAANKNVAVFAAGTISLSTINSDVALSGTGTMLLSTARDINLSNGASITTGSGSLTLEANQQPVATSGNFIGVSFNNSKLISTSGAVTVRGRGGNDSTGSQFGIRLLSGAEVGTGTSGLVTVQGTGGASTGNNNYGLQVGGVNSLITSGGGNVVATGTGGGTGSSTDNTGVSIEGRGVISAGGAGTVGVTGSGSGTTGANAGVVVTGIGSQITSGGGAVAVVGTGAGGLTLVPGVLVSASGTITAGSTGNVTVNGTSNGTGQNSHGVYVTGSSSFITSAGGNVSVTGTGGGATTATANYGVFIETGATVSAGGVGTVTVTGTGRNTSGSGAANHGVVISGTNARVTSGGGNISITGTGGGGSGSTGDTGVRLQSGATISSLGAAAINITGTGGTATTGTGSNGVTITDNGTAINSGSGGLTITGTLGSNGSTTSIETTSSALINGASTGIVELIGDFMRINSTITAASGTIIVRPKTPSRQIDIGGSDNFAALGIANSELSNLTANLVQIGTAASGNIASTTSISAPSNLLLTTGGEVSLQNVFTMAVNKNFSAVAASTVRLPNTASDLSTSGTGTVNISTPRNIILSSGSSINTANGSLTLSANQQPVSTAGAFIGIEVNSATLRTVNAEIILYGRGGSANGSSLLHGISVTGGASARFESTTGNARLNGTGGGTGTTHSNYGVLFAGTIALNSAAMIMDGQGGNTTGTGATNHGVWFDGSRISGSWTVTGRGGGGTSGDNVGVYINSPPSSVGNLTGTGFGGGLLGGGNNNHGVFVFLLNGGGDISLTGTGGGALGSTLNHGIVVDNGGIAATTLTMNGFGGNLTGTGGSNAGVSVINEVGLTTSGNMSISGVGGGGPTTGGNTGVSLSAVWVRTTGTGSITVNGTGGASAASISSGVTTSFWSGVGNGMSAANGSINITATAAASHPTPLRIRGTSQLTATGASGGVTFTTNGLEIESTSSINAGANPVTIKIATANTPINLGAADAPGLLALTDTKLDRITAGTLNIGDNTSGTLTVSGAITRTAATAMSLNSGGNINFTTGSLATANGNVTLNPTSTLSPATTGVDINAGTGTVSFGSGDDLTININGFTVDTQHQQLNVLGGVNLTGADLFTSGNLTATGGEVITIINNDGVDAVAGTFNGLAEGASLGTNFLNSGLSASISYVGGTNNNDVVIVIGSPAPTTHVDLAAGTVTITDVLNDDTNDTLTISIQGSNLRIQDLNQSLAAQGGGVLVDSHTVDVSLALVTGSLQINTLGGNDSVTLDFSGGNFIPPGGVIYDGGASLADSLTVTGGTTTSADHFVSDDSEGSITLSGALAGGIYYSSVEPILDGLVATNRTFQLNAGAETITVADAAGAFNLLTSSLGHAITFANPTTNLTIDAIDGNDTINFNSVDTQGPFSAALTINGGTGDDTVNLNADLTFAADLSLNVDLQNDDLTPGTDTINISAGTNLLFSGNGTATLKASRNVLLLPGSSVVTANGMLLVEANQQTTASTGDFVGVEVNGGALHATGIGVVTVRGRGGSGNAGLQVGTLVTNGGAIRGGTTGNTLVQGTGGASTANENHGVRVLGPGSAITSLGASVQVIGVGGGSGAASTSNRGVDVESSGPGTAVISAGSAGHVIVNGTGSNTRASAGVRVAGVSGLITSTTGTVQVTGQGGNGATSSAIGVWVDRGTITSGVGGGSVSVSGLGGASASGQNHGVLLESSVVTTGKITSGGGAVQVLGTAGNGAGGANVGVFVATGGEITAPAASQLTITGTGGQGATGGNAGVFVRGPIQSVDRNVTILGTGGEGATSHGIRLDQASLAVGSTSVLRLQGVATAAGVLALVAGDPATATSISHTGTGTIEFVANTVHIETTATITNSLGVVSFTPTTTGRSINLGSTVDTTPNTLELSDAELDRVTASGLQIGDAGSGAVTLSAPITRAAATIVNVDSAGAINFSGGSLSSGGGNVRLNAGTNLVPVTAGVDVSAGASGIIRFGAGDRLTLNLGGPTVDTQYNQLNVVGQVDLTGVQLILSGPLPALGDGFIIVNNDGTADPVIGTFDALPEGTMVDVNGLAKRLTYTGGDGNDVVLLPGNTLPTINSLGDLAINEDVLQQTVNLTGITAGNEAQAIMVTATSSQPTIIPTPTVTYTSPNTTGTLQYTPAANANGAAIITVTVRDAGNDGQFNTADDAVASTSFQVSIQPINDRPTFNTLGDQGVVFNAPAQTVPGWANSILPGPSNETGQTVTFSVTGNTNPGLFQVNPVIANNGTLTYTPTLGISGSSTITVVAQDSGGTALGGLDTSVPQTFVITIGPELTLRVVSVVMTPTGFVAEFNRQLNANALNLYDLQGNPFGAADVVLQRAGAAFPTRGSIVLDSTLTKLTFVATTGLLPSDDYTVTLRAAANGIVDTLGTVLDGNNDNIPGGDYVQTFEVEQNPSAVTISIPNFARGPRQDVNLPANSTSGIPVSFSNGEGLLFAQFQIRFDPALLDITGATVFLPGTSVGTMLGDGVLDVFFSSADALPVGTTHFINLQARVPDDAPYTEKHVLDIGNILLSDNIPGVDDDAIAVVAFFGDVTANGAYSGQDVSYVARLSVGIDSGFEKFKMLDPNIIGDVSGNGSITASEISLMLQAAVSINVPEIPSPLPAGSLILGGPDPKLSIPRNLAAVPGQALSIPVDIDSIVDLTGTGLESGDFVIYYDPNVLDVSAVSLGRLIANRGWLISSNINPLAGRIDISIAGMRKLEGRFLGELVQIHATVREDAPAGTSAINLAADSRTRQTQLNEGFLTLIPAPTDAANDPIDGLLTITSATPATAVPTARLVDGRLLIVGTAGDDRILLRPTADGTQLQVRANDRILGTFALPNSLVIDALTGSDYVYVDPKSPAALIAIANDARPRDLIFTGDNAELTDSPNLATLTGGVSQALSLNDLALLHLLDQWTATQEGISTDGGQLRRRR